MNFRRTSAAIVCSLALAASGAAFAMDVDELVAKAVEAQGGAAALKALKSQKSTGKVLTQGMEIAYTMVYARPNRLRIDASVMGMTMVQCFDGTDGWSINPMTGSQGPQPMGDMEIKGFRLQADMDGPYVDWAAKGYAAEYMGQEDVAGTPAYRLQLDTKQDIVLDFWFDAESFLVLQQTTKMKLDQGEFETQTYLSDYRQQGGFTMPFRIETRQGDQVTMEMAVDTLEFNVPVDQAMFAKPAAAPAAGAPGK